MWQRGWRAARAGVLAAGAVVLCAPVAAGCAPDEWSKGEDYRWRDLAVAPSSRTGFTRLPQELTAIRFANHIDAQAAVRQRALLGGGGVAAGDINGDGNPDLYFVGTSRPNALFLNEGGLRFREIPGAGGAMGAGKPSAGAAFADTDGDNDLDLVLTGVGDLRVYVNDGGGRFEDVSVAAGVTSTAGNTSVALADIEKDGDLDLYVASWRRDTLRDEGAELPPRVDGRYQIPKGMGARFEVIDGELIERGEPDALFINDGRGTFTPASWSDGRFLDEDGEALDGPPLDWGLAVAFHDVNGDGSPDLYVCNDFDSPDRFWINDGAGRFRAIPRTAIRGTSASSMGVDFADVDRDGDVDFFVDDMLSPDRQRRLRQVPALDSELPLPGVLDHRPQLARNTLQLARGDGTYAEAANMAGVGATDWSWSAAFTDVDLDGFDDLLVVNGHLYDMLDADSAAAGTRMAGRTGRRSALLDFEALKTANVAFRNLSGELSAVADGPRFERVSEAWGFGDVGITHGLALADLDGDGDLDVVTNNVDEPAGIYRNDGDAPRIAVRLVGRSPNTRGIGAKIRLLSGRVPEQTQEMIAGGRYLSGSEPLLSFAAGQRPMVLVIEWPRGAVSRIGDVRANRMYEVTEPEPRAATAVAPAVQAASGALFEDVSDRLRHRHHEDDFDDLAVQSLLPRRLSILGPGLAWADLDSNGTEDLVVGAGRAGVLGVFLGDGAGAFRIAGSDRIGAETDYVGLAAEVTARGTRLLAGVSTWDTPSADESPSTLLSAHAPPVPTVPDALQSLTWSKGRSGVEPLVSGSSASPGPVAIADVEGDGDLDVFIGGRAIPRRYPQAAPSRLLRRQGANLVEEPADQAVLDGIGLVSGAVWTDLTGDGLPELALAREWGSPAVFWNRGGHLEEGTESIGLSASAPHIGQSPGGRARTLASLGGWWNGVASADLDSDGAMDLVLTNWGRNTEYQPTEAHPIGMLYGDLDRDGTVELLETQRDPFDEGEFPLRRIDDLGRSFTLRRDRIESFADYAAATVAELLGSEVARLERVEATTLDHIVLLNRGRQFDVHPLPAEAQVAPAFGVSAADFDGDGRVDVFIAQNFSGQQPALSPANAGRGLLMAGDGTGGLHPLGFPASGIAMYGDGRGSAVADFDADGRPDLAVAQNATDTRLFRNQGGSPGLRVRLAGPPDNSAAIGAMVRAVRAGGRGPAVELHAGSGYWSSDALVVLVPGGRNVTHLEVRWPGGTETVYEVPAGAREVRVSPDRLDVVRPGQ